MSRSMSRGSSVQAEEPPVQMQEGRRVCVFKEEPEAGVAGRARNFDEIQCLARSCVPPGY